MEKFYLSTLNIATFYLIHLLTRQYCEDIILYPQINIFLFILLTNLIFLYFY